VSETTAHLTRQEIDGAWQLRIDGQLDPTLTQCASFRKALPLLQERIDEVFLQKIFKEELADIYLDYVLLQASLARAQKRTDEFQRILGLVKSALTDHSLPTPFWLVFEEAIFAFRSGDFSTALDGFSLADGKARTPFEHLLIKINTACCLYTLGQAFTHALAECDFYLKQVEEQAPASHLNAIRNQKSALEVFYQFRHGNIETILDSQIPQGTPTDFLRAWCLQLPYQRFFQKNRLNEDELRFSSSTCLEPAYRQRTLLGLIHPTDQNPPRLSDWADRVYLWTWRWLAAPDSFSIEKVLANLAPLKQSTQLYLLSVEDKKLIRNALLWLGLFDSSSRRVLHSLLKLVEVSEISDHPLLESESLFIHYWMSLRDHQSEAAKDYLAALQESVLLNHRDLLFCDLLSATLPTSHPLHALSQRLKGFSKKQAQNRQSVLVDFSTGKITNFQTKEEVYSEPMVYAIEALIENGVASFEQLAAVSFGISTFDPVLHTTKIFNLISRMKEVFSPFISFKTKHRKVYAEGDFRQIQLKNAAPAERSLFSYSNWRELIYERRVSHASVPERRLQSIDSEAALSREQIQSLCRKSRATTGRLIQSWHKKGWVQKVGNARATRYRLSSFLQNELKEGRLAI